MKRGYIAFLLVMAANVLIFANPAEKRTSSREDYIKKYKSIAIEEMHRSGIPASITLAQGCLESADGNSRLARKANNHFGIKCKGDWNGKRTFHDDDRPNECFRKYNNPYESYFDHTKFLLNGQRYRFLFKLEVTNYKEWAKGLKKAGYATDPKYADRLIKIIEDNKLYLFDGVTSREYRLTKKKEARKRFISGAVNPYAGRTISEINRIKGVVARKGDSYAQIAKETGIKEWEILKFNEAEKGDAPDEGEFVYIGLKRSKAAHGNDVHIVKEGESMRSIALQYGVKLKRLYRMNRMKPGEEIAIEMSINLRKKKKK